MSVFKCKMCGGDLALIEGQSVAECEYCGTRQTVPSVDNEKKLTLFTRANRLRAACEFDKAAGIYEAIIADFKEEAEAYWGLVLCKYGIEYVDDSVTGKKIPTCHRSSFDSIMEDSDFEQVLKNAGSDARRIYHAEAKQIEEVRKGIIAVSNNEPPYDIFICYKETDEKGDRTLDSVLAQGIYETLTIKGYHVFFARITLEDKLGLEYEPYIFAALNSAKIMLAVGTDVEYYNAVWVKNEWSRFLKLMSKDRTKHLIPCYKGIDVYDMPQEFIRLQAQDLGKVGAIQDLLRGIEKILPEKETTISITHGDVFNNKKDALLKRTFMFLEDGEWNRADEFCEQVLNIDPECAEAYLGKLMVKLRVHKRDELKNCKQPFDRNSHYQKALRFAGDALRKELQTSLDYINERNKKAPVEDAARLRKNNKRILHIAVVICVIFVAVLAILFSKPLSQYLDAVSLMKEGEYDDAIVAFEMLDDFMDSDKKIVRCKTAILDSKYNEAIALMDASKYEEAITAFEALDGYKNSAGKITECENAILNRKYNNAVALVDAGNYTEALIVFDAIGNYSDAKEQAELLRIKMAIQKTIAAGRHHTVGLKADGTVVAVGQDWDSQYHCEVSAWTDIVAISAGGDHTVGLKADGTVVAVGDNRYGQRNVEGWTDIISISAGVSHTVGLKADGTVVAVGFNEHEQCRVSGWTDIIAINAGGSHTAGLKANGTVVVGGWNEYGQCNVAGWTDIVAISVGNTHTVGLRADGTVVAVGDNDDGQSNVEDWTDIVAIAAGNAHTVGLKADGTVVAVGDNDDGQCNVAGWTDIVSISAGDWNTVGLKADGTVVAVGSNAYDQCNVKNWTNIKVPN